MPQLTELELLDHIDPSQLNKRCTNPKDEYFKWYGQRGISICSEWGKYEVFRKWALENGYNDRLTIDRINTNGNYSPENCQWATLKEQQNNRRNNRIIELNGKTYTISQLAEAFKIKRFTIQNRLRLGWDPERIIKVPERSKRRET